VKGLHAEPQDPVAESIGIGRRVIRHEALRELIELRASLFERGVGAESGDDDAAIPAAKERVERLREPDVDVLGDGHDGGKPRANVRRQHADDRPIRVVDVDLAADDIRIPTERSAPQAVADDDPGDPLVTHVQ
jgi:hypothetical protein